MPVSERAITISLPPVTTIDAQRLSQKTCGASYWRHLLAAGLLLLAIASAPALTVWNLTFQTNTHIALLQWLFVLVLAPEVLKSVRRSLAESLTFRVLVFGFIACLLGWLAQGIAVGDVGRTSFYLVQPLFVLAACAWFDRVGDAGLRGVYWAKLLATAGAVIYLLVMLWQSNVLEIDLRKVRPLPIYRHIRHLGYDLAVVASLAAAFWAVRPTAARFGNWFLFFAIGYVSLRSGGRGQIVDFFAFIVIGIWVIRGGEARRALTQALAAFVFGGVMLHVFNPESISWFFGRAVAGTPDQVASGRFEIWAKVVALVSADWLSLLVGLGPEAFMRNQVMPGLVQAHNAAFQVLLEFGLVGLAVIILALFDLARRCWVQLRANDGDVLFAGAFTSFVAMLLYSLVDGIFYHASPFLASMLLIAFLLTRCGNGRRTHVE